MKIFDAVYTAAVFLQLDELCDAMNSEGFDRANWKTNVTGETAAELDILLRCCNLVFCELSETEFPLRTTCELAVEGGKIAYDDLPEKVTDIYAVRADGASVPFRQFYDCITLPVSGKVTVEYSFAPPAVTLDGQSPYSGNKPSARLVAYGIAREYCLISGMTDDATLWDGRFTACAEEEAAVKRERRVRRRAWR